MDMNRRDFLRTAGGTAGATATVAAGTGTATAQSGNQSDGNQSSGNQTGGNQTGGNESAGGGATSPPGPPDLGGYLDGANLYEGSAVNKMGQNTVTVEVGAGEGFAFAPPAVHVSNGATVQWEWTGEGGAHNVVETNEVFNSGSPVSESGVNFEYTFEEDGIYKYYCSPHQGQGMLGAIIVGTDYAQREASGGGHEEKEPHEMGVPFQAHFVGLATMLMMVVSVVFTFFQVKYGESPHAKGGND